MRAGITVTQQYLDEAVAIRHGHSHLKALFATGIECRLSGLERGFRGERPGLEHCFLCDGLAREKHGQKGKDSKSHDATFLVIQGVIVAALPGGVQRDVRAWPRSDPSGTSGVLLQVFGELARLRCAARVALGDPRVGNQMPVQRLQGAFTDGQAVGFLSQGDGLPVLALGQA